MTRQLRHVLPVATSADQWSDGSFFTDHDAAVDDAMGVTNPNMLVVRRTGTGKSAASLAPWLSRRAR